MDVTHFVYILVDQIYYMSCVLTCHLEGSFRDWFCQGGGQEVVGWWLSQGKHRQLSPYQMSLAIFFINFFVDIDNISNSPVQLW